MIQTARETRAQFDIVFVPPDFAVSKNTPIVLANTESIPRRKVQSANTSNLPQTKLAETCPGRFHDKENGSIEQQAVNPEKKRVRFAMDSKMNRKVKCEFFGDNIPPIDISPREINPIWYCPTEFGLFKKESKRDIGSQGGKAACQKAYLMLYRFCRSAQGMRQISLPQSAAFCASRSRGLEKYFFSKDTLSGNAVRSVLEEQMELRRAGVKDVTLPLAIFCSSQSAPARRMARVLGAGDEYVARQDSDRC